MADINSLLIFFASYLIVFLLTIFLFVFLSRGFFWKWFRALTSRGRLLLIEVRDPLQNYFITGKVEGNNVFLKDKECSREKDKHKVVQLTDYSCVVKKNGVNNLIFDPEKNTFLTPNLQGVSGFDPLKMNNLLVRALTKPSEKEKKILQVIILIGIVILLLFLFLLYKEVKDTQLLISSLKTALPKIINTSISGGV